MPKNLQNSGEIQKFCLFLLNKAPISSVLAFLRPLSFSKFTNVREISLAENRPQTQLWMNEFSKAFF